MPTDILKELDYCIVFNIDTEKFIRSTTGNFPRNFIEISEVEKIPHFEELSNSLEKDYLYDKQPRSDTLK